jgi:NAD(P)-dependent dehydrogenase (short-subunit alcohol dehydrogenase family)
MAETHPLKGKAAVITGGSRGIGFAVAQAFNREGCHVVITARDDKKLKSAAAELDSSRAEVIGQRCDVSDPAQVDELFEQVKRRYSALDILVNNAGIAHSLAPVEKLSVADWKRVIDTNLTGMFLCTRAALLLMRAGGTIVNNLSVAATQPFEGMAAYNASKYGALGFTNVLREELRERGIRVLALIPGPTDTEIWNQFWAEAPRERMVSAATVADAVVHAVTLPAVATIEEIKLRPTVGSLRA